jgi:two-component system, LytTR family, sensor kinase
MTHGRPRPALTVPWLSITMLWLAIGTIEACQTVFPMRAQGMHHAWSALFVTVVLSWLPWAIATPVVMRLAWHHPLFRAPTLRGIVRHAGALVVIGLASAAWYALLEYELNPWALPNPPASYLTVLTLKLSYGALTTLVAYGLLIVIAEILASRDRLSRATGEAAELRAALSEARLVSLQQQMDPHFLFNALNSVCGLVRDHQNDSAVRMLVAVSEYLRSAAERSQTPVVTLDEEVHYLEQYLDIQKYRFGPRLHTAIDVPANLRSLRVPSLLLQPLAENAVKHGIATRASGGSIRVTAAVDAGELLLVVRNTAADSGSSEPPQGLGLGLENLRARLRLLFGEAHQLDLRRMHDDVEVRITIPVQSNVAYGS